MIVCARENLGRTLDRVLDLDIPPVGNELIE